ncbi:Ig-like domain-containing protein [Adhaeribacter rhizoryzae]|uniref:T9SS type A sorting domain-containing protein n=1 Tax=Adhaeribacter rhizoryzae TaxID=2607907 RepID=A0A5M6DMJ8_9BACT|nr:Ig-like domain-containing protein [Adhaeribacter rhizoryzae]KAA5548767.1 T9SS type A sorting domain-containing protein [Adhaeribacter rhizoryzae]
MSLILPKTQPGKRQQSLRLLIVLLLTWGNFLTLEAQTTYPAPQRFTKPSPEPAAPGDAFTPPVNGTASTSAPQAAEWTRTAGPDESIVLTGVNFSRYTGADAGKDTRFMIYGRNSTQKEARIQRLDNDKTILTLPKDLPGWSMYLIWPGNEAGYGNPIAVNKTDVWWAGPDKATRNQTVSVFGRNLAQNNDTLRSYIYLKPVGGGGQWVNVTDVNPYRVDFTVPAGLPNGEYEIWAHNGHGGQYGWSGPQKITIYDGPQWTNTVFNVKNYGAAGNGYNNDTDAIRKAIDAARQSPGATVYFPAGTYMISSYLHIYNDVKWKGDGRSNTIIKCAPTFNSEYGMVFGNVARTFSISDMGFDTNNNFRGNRDKPVILRDCQDVWIHNVRFNFKGFNLLDLHNSRRVFMTNTDHIGISTFLGNCSQLFIDRNNFYMTNDSDMALHTWGGGGISMTRSTCRDLDNSNLSSGAGWGKGRFFVGNGSWGSNHLTYLANNITYDLTPRPAGDVDQNSGEQFLWEGNLASWAGYPSSSSATSTTLNGLSGYTNESNSKYVAIVKGKGLGQTRRIITNSGGVITLDEPWNVIPDASSYIVVGDFADRIAIYKNSFDGKARASTSPTHVAAAAIEPFGGSFNVIADNNTMTDLQQGIANFSTQHTTGMDPNFFNLFTNNTMRNVKWGMYNEVGRFSRNEGTFMLGITYRNNTVESAVSAGFYNSLPQSADVLNASVYEHNAINNAPEGLITSKEGLSNLLFYKNNFNGVSKALPTTTKMALRENSYAGVGKFYDGTLPGAIIEAPLHVVEIEGKAGGSVVKSNFVLYNSGYTAMNWAATSSAGWLTLSANGGTIENEREIALIELSANPAGLPVGLHRATISVTAGAITEKYTVEFDLTAPTNGVTITAPTANATFAASDQINITATATDANAAVTKVEFFAGSTKLGEDLTSPYSFNWTNAPAGTHALTAKATNSTGQVTTSAVVSVTKTNNNEPTITLTAPTGGSKFAAPASITITANASDTDGTIAKVEFYNGNTKIGEDTSSPYAFDWYNVDIGTYAITAKAIDNAGGSATSAPVMVSVLTATVPTVAIVTPGENSTHFYPTNVRILANAELTNGNISRVEFYANGNKIADRGYAPFEIHWMNIPTGTYTVTARAIGSNGVAGTSAPVKFNVVNLGTLINTAPTVSIASPTSTNSFKAPAGINITANASDANGSISKVEYFYGTTKLGESTTAPYTFNWSNVTTGTYEITAKATDNAGTSTTSAPVKVTVGTSNTISAALPTVNITSPTASTNLLAPAVVTITANAVDSDGTISKVEFYQGGIKLGEDTSSPYSFTWLNVLAGVYPITARAIDNSGLSSTSAPVNITVQLPILTPAPAPSAPVVTLTSPSANSNFTAPANITIAANASSTDGSISKVEFFNGSTKVGEDITSPYSFTWSNVSAGTYTLTARATNNVGQTTTSAPVNVNVNAIKAPEPTPEANPDSAPVAEGLSVTLTAPIANSTQVIPTNLYLSAKVTSDEGTIRRVEFYNGTTRLGEKTWAPYEAYYINAPAGNYSITAKVTSSTGATAISAPVTVTVLTQNGTTPAPAPSAPEVALTSPSANSSFTAPASITIAANASSTDGSISKVEFFNGSSKVGEDLTSPYSFTWSNVSAGSYTLTARATNNVGQTTTSAPVNVNVTPVITPAPAPAPSTACSGTGSISWDYWANVPAWYNIDQIPVNNTPTASRKMTSFSSPTNIGDYFGARLRGYICPPVSGNYVFYIAGDDQADLFISTDDNPANKTHIAHLSSTTGIEQYDKDASQQSKTIYLQAGRRYYIEALHKEGVGLDNVSVAWKLPNGTMQAPIAGAHLMPFESSSLLSSRSADSSLEIFAGGTTGQTLSAYPNPFSNGTSIQFSLPTEEAYTLSIFDMKGSLIKTLQQGKAKANELVQVQWEAGNIPAGIYIAKLVTKSGVQNIKIVRE